MQQKNVLIKCHRVNLEPLAPGGVGPPETLPCWLPNIQTKMAAINSL